MTTDEFDNPIADFLRARGHTDAEVKKILAHVKQYDIQTQHDSAMDSLADGRFSLDDIIKQALAKSD